MKLKIKKFNNEALIPSYQTKDSAGADLCALLSEDLIILPGQIAMIPTGLSFEIPSGFEVQIRARSGLASKGLIIPNAPGTIDADYRGEIKILLCNLSGVDFTITPQMRIAQMVLASVTQADFEITEELSNTTRGDGGFGSTGLV
ncbi:MAG: dUTP diphosphatase [Brevinema sp.]